MKLIPKSIKIPNIGETENEENPKALIKLFHPCSSWSWYVVEYSPEDKLCFGVVDGFEAEMGYFSLEEIQSVRVMGIGVERDLHWEPVEVKELLSKLKRR